MPRAPRRIEPGGIYHAAPRGNDGRAIFLGDADRSRFLVRLGLVAARYEWLVFGYCLMTNHAHLLVQVPEAGLSEGMRELLGNMRAGGTASMAITATCSATGSPRRRCAPSAI
jgi:REP element-mobilizing transposase RayT